MSKNKTTSNSGKRKQEKGSVSNGDSQRAAGGARRFRAIQDHIHIRRYRPEPGVAGRGAATLAAADADVSRGGNKRVRNFIL
jgi:hypothetical protein